MKLFRDRDTVLLGLLLVCLAAVLTAAMSAQGAPITGSQVITLERGPDGLWLSQAWAVEWQARPDLRLALIYDTWRHTPGATDLTLAYRQWDVSATYERVPSRGLPWSVTAGVRWRTGITGRTYGGAGPWKYVMVSVGW